MAGSSIEVIVTLENPELSDEEIQVSVRTLRNQLAELEELQDVMLLPVSEALPGAKGIGGFVLGKLKALLNLDALKKMVGVLGQNLFGSSIEVEAKGNGRELKIKIRTPEDLQQVMPEVERFING
ncbi:hypothetical protein QGP82_31405 [Leptothoe sp. LEGE 181152]|uniref:Uncharacterized protein n=1 Tax=Adonisia turfae CCMR0081 TaxID=2292702 RepID=A0A6M0RKV6_9CYAN|nr:hypothetical protein [Adonisia turfae]MDV3353223.1 hypothetical protein [Leptothoe sp. LEGE 181152]NEZ56835.1 hypothetical protein [Adonisia turfae CCMR0081]